MHVSTHADAHPHYTQKSKETVCQLILSNLYFYVLLSKTNKPTKQNKTKNQQQNKNLETEYCLATLKTHNYNSFLFNNCIICP